VLLVSLNPSRDARWSTRRDQYLEFNAQYSSRKINHPLTPLALWVVSGCTLYALAAQSNSQRRGERVGNIPIIPFGENSIFDHLSAALLPGLHQGTTSALMRDVTTIRDRASGRVRNVGSAGRRMPLARLVRILPQQLKMLSLPSLWTEPTVEAS
jgi:hypothetical protein